jgi:hypothetical protein
VVSRAGGGVMERRNLYPLPEIGPRFLGRRANNLVFILTELSRLPKHDVAVFFRIVLNNLTIFIKVIIGHLFIIILIFTSLKFVYLYVYMYNKHNKYSAIN